MSRKCAVLSLLTIFSVSLGGTASAYASTRIYVDSRRSGTSGVSWLTAFPSVQSALAEVAKTTDTVEIWVAQGEYFPSKQETSTDPHSMTFKIGNNVKLYGGFAGSESSLDDRDPQTYETILSGRIDTYSSSGTYTGCYYCYHVVTFEVTTSTSVLSGFTITNGYASGYGHTGSDSTLGGGVLVRSGSASIGQCVFKNNRAADRGGAIAMTGDNSGAVITRCLFLANEAQTYGGAVYIDGLSPHLVSCAFSGNTCLGGSGGGLATWHGSPRMINCTFSQNSAGQGGGVYAAYNSSSPTLDNCILWGNTAFWGSTEEEQIELASASATIRYTCVEGWTGSLGGSNNGGHNPKLQDALGADGVVGTDDDNMRLSLTSPSINTGDDSLMPWFYALNGDLDGRGRILGSRIDRGAYERK